MITMGWLKHVVIDLAITVVIIIATTTGLIWAQWVVWIYTPFMLLLKIGALSGNGKGPASNTDVPEWFFHLLYGINVAVLFFFHWWYPAAGWAGIWVLSFIAAQRAKK